MMRINKELSKEIEVVKERLKQAVEGDKKEMTLSVAIIVKDGENDILKAVHSMGSVGNECVSKVEIRFEAERTTNDSFNTGLNPPMSET